MQSAGSRGIMDNPTTEPGNVVINGQQWSDHAFAREGKIYGTVSATLRHEILNKEPVWTLADSPVHPTHSRGEGTKVLVFSALNGVEKKGETFRALRKRLVFVGFSRSEPMHQHMAGRKNGAVAVHIGGLITVINTGPHPIPRNSWVRMRLPNPRDVSQEWKDRDPHKVVGEIVPYDPLSDRASREAGYEVLSKHLRGEDVTDVLEYDEELQSYVELNDALNMVRVIAVVEYQRATTGRDPTSEEVLQLAAQFGVLTPKSAADKEAARRFQLRLLRRTFGMSDENGQVLVDPKQIYFRLGAAGANIDNIDEANFAQKQSVAMEQLINAAITTQETKRSEVIGRAPFGGQPMQPMDLYLSSKTV